MVATQWFPTILACTFGGRDYTFNLSDALEAAIENGNNSYLSSWTFPVSFSQFFALFGNDPLPNVRKACVVAWKMSNTTGDVEYFMTQALSETMGDPARMTLDWSNPPSNAVLLSNLLPKDPDTVKNNCTVLAAFAGDKDVTSFVAERVSQVPQLPIFSNPTVASYGDSINLTISLTDILAHVPNTSPTGYDFTVVFATNHKLQPGGPPVYEGKANAYAINCICPSISTNPNNPSEIDLNFSIPTNTTAHNEKRFMMQFQSAVYGGRDCTTTLTYDYLNHYQYPTNGMNTYSFTPSNGFFGGDPAPNILKEYVIIFNLVYQTGFKYRYYGSAIQNCPTYVKVTSKLLAVTGQEGQAQSIDLANYLASGDLYPAIDWYLPYPTTFVPPKATAIKAYWSTTDFTNKTAQFLFIGGSPKGWNFELLALGTPPPSIAPQKQFFILMGWWWNNTLVLRNVTSGTEVSPNFLFMFPVSSFLPDTEKDQSRHTLLGSWIREKHMARRTE